MATGPIDYTRAFAQGGGPFGNIMQGLEAGAQFANIEQMRSLRDLQIQAAQQAQAEQQAQREQQAALSNAMSSLINNPNPTFQDYQRVAMMLPADRSKALMGQFEAMTADRQQNELRFAGNVLTAIRTGAPDVGLNLIRERIEAERNSGRPDAEQRAQGYETWAKLLETAPAQAGATIGALVSQLPGADKLLENISKVGTEERAAAAFGPEQIRRVADAALARIKAENEPARFAAEMGLTDAQTQQARVAATAQAAAARASEATRAAAQAQADSLAAGILTPAQRLETETKLRGEYRAATATFREVRDAFGRVQASQDTAVGDLSLIFAYMKMLDPGSVVREGEFATAQNAAGVPERIQNIYNRVVSGQRLTAGQRNSFKAQAADLYRTAGQEEAKVRDGISRIARNYGVNTDNIFIEQQVTPPTPPRQATPQPTGPGGGRGFPRPAASGAPPALPPGFVVDR